MNAALAALSAAALLASASSAAGQRARGQEASEDIDAGRAIVQRMGCVACHVIPGQPGPYGRVGPRLGGLSARVYIAGSLPNTMDNLLAWLLDPPALRPDTPMPRLGLSREEARQVAAYLRALPGTALW